MSTTVDERVVEMRFDNKHFESNVATSMSTLEKLRRSLKLDGASKGLENINSAAKNNNLGVLGESANAVGLRFNAMYTIADQALRNITTRVQHTAESMLKALTLDPITTGFQEYETQINSVQTILANTSSKGTTITDVTAALDELNKYADLTIYNFTEMTRNIGTFTAAGIDLDTSVNAIQGIANLAAVSGSTSQQASTAMYQLSQALATGTVKLMDWNSVVNAGMGGEVFQNALKETSRLLGTGADAAIEASGSFRESLSQGWLTAEVLTETLKKFTSSGAVEYISEYTGLSQEAVNATLDATDAWGNEADAVDKAAEALAEKSGKNKEEIKDALQMAKNAQDAATKVKTFSQLWDVMKEAAQSGWAKTWQIIIGDFEEAKSLLTPLSDFFTNVINKMSDWRNGLLESALGKGFIDLADKIDGVLKPASKVAETIGKVTDTLSDFDEIVNNVIRGDFGNGEDRFNALTEAGENYYKVQNKVNEALGNSHRYSEEQIAAQDKLLGKQGEASKATSETQEATVELTDAQKEQIKSLAKLSDEQLKSKGYTDEQIEAFRELRNTAEELGIPLDDFIVNLDEINGRWLLINSFKNIGTSLIKAFTAIGKAWREIFDPIQADQIFDIVAAFHKYTRKLIPTEKTTKKLTRTFKGLFAVLDIIKTILSGGINIAFKTLSAVLSAFELDILDVTANVGDTLVAFRDWALEGNALAKAFDKLLDKLPDIIKDFEEWFNVFKETPAVQGLVDAVNAIIDAFDKMFSGEIDANEFARILGENLAKTLLSLPKIAIQAGKDFIAGFSNGLVDGVGELIKKVLEFCKNFCSSFAAALGIQSPSTIAYQNAVDWCQGFINGLTDMLGPILNALDPIIEGVKKVFSSFWKYITDENGDIEWGKIAAGAVTIESLLILNKFANAMDKFASAATSFSGIISGVTNAMKSFKKVLDGVSLDLKAQALLKLAVAIGILAAAIWVLAQIEDPTKLWRAVGVIVILAGVIIGLAWATEALSKATVVWDNGPKIEGLKQGLIQIGIAMLLLAAVVKLIGDMTPEEADRGFKGLAALAGGMIVFMAGMAAVSLYAKDVSNFGGTMIKLGVAMGLMVIVMKMIVKMDPADVLVGIAVMELFALLCIEFGIANRIAGANDNGSSFLKLSIAMGVMVLVMKMIAKMDPNDIMVGVAVMQAFVILLGEMAIVNRIAGSEQKKFAGTIIAMSFSMVILAGVLLLLSKLDPIAVDNGLAVMQKFVLLIAELILVANIAGRNSSKIAGNILSMAIAIGILAGITILIGSVQESDLLKGVALVGTLALIMSTMIWATRGANNVRAELIVMTTAIGVMAACIVALSLIDDQGRLAVVTGLLGGLMLCFAAMAKAASTITNAKSVTAALAVMVGVVLVLSGVIYFLSVLKVESALPNAAALGILMLAFAASIKIIDGVNFNMSFKQLQSMALVVLEMAVILSIMSLLPNPEKAIPSAIAIGILLNTLATSMLIMSKAKGNFKMTFVQLQSMALVIAEVGLVLGLMSLLPNPEKAIPSAIAIGILLNTMASALLVMSYAKTNYSVTCGQLQSMALVVLELAAILGVMSALDVHASIPNAIAIGILLNLMASAMVIASLAGQNASMAVGPMLSMGLVVAEIALVFAMLTALKADAALPMAQALGTVLIAMSAACLIASFIPVAGAIQGAVGLATFISVMGVVIAAFGALATIPGFTTIMEKGSEMFSIIGEAIGGFCGGIISGIGSAVISLIPQLGAALFIFGISIKPFLAVVESMSAETVTKAGFLTATIGALTVASFIEGIGSLFGLGLPKLGADLAKFGECVGEFSGYLSDVDAVAVEAAGNVATMMLTLTANDIIDSLTSWLTGGVNYEDMGTNLKAFGEAVVGFSQTISGKIDVAAVEAATNAGALLVELNKSLPRSGGWFQDIIGEQDFGKFAEACKSFATCILEINEVVSQEGFEIQEEKIGQLVTAGTKFSELNKALPRSDGWLQDIIGEQDLSKFGESVKAFANCIIALNETLSDEALVIQEDKLTQLAAAGTKFSDLNNALPRSDGWLQDVVGEQDLTKFGTAVEKFAECIIGVNESLNQEGFSVNLDGMEQLKQAGLKMNELQSALPKSGGWWESIAGSEDIGDFGESIKTFADAIVDFSTKSTGLDQEAILSCLYTVTRIKNLMTSLIGLDYSGVDAFTGIGSGGFGADGPAYDIAQAIVKFSDTVKDIDTEAVPIAVTAANNLKTLIASLVGLDTSGIENFKPGEIGNQMKNYADKVSGIDTETVSSSISSANKLKSFIAGLVGLDTSGIVNFKIASIGASLSNYSNTISGFDSGAVALSITAAYRLKDFVSSLSGINTSGVGSFKSAVAQLSTIDIAGLVKAFSGASVKLSNSGADMIDGLIKGMRSKLPAVSVASTKIAITAHKAVTSKASTFATAGETLANKLINGFSSKKSLLTSTTSFCLSSVVSTIRSKYSSFYSAGSYLVDGFAAGISENSYKPAAKAKAMAEAAVKAAREALKINSPSKVFKEIGSGVPEGFAMGIGMLGGEVKRSVTGMASTAITSTRSAMATVLDALNADMDAQPTIRPVVDLSDVQTGAAAIHGMFNGVQTVGVRSNLNAINATMNAKLQNGANDDIVSAINKLHDGLEGNRGDIYNFGDFTYDDSSNISEAVHTLVRAAKMGRRV